MSTEVSIELQRTQEALVKAVTENKKLRVVNEKLEKEKKELTEKNKLVEEELVIVKGSTKIFQETIEALKGQIKSLKEKSLSMKEKEAKSEEVEDEGEIEELDSLEEFEEKKGKNFRIVNEKFVIKEKWRPRIMKIYIDRFYKVSELEFEQILSKKYGVEVLGKEFYNNIGKRSLLYEVKLTNEHLSIAFLAILQTGEIIVASEAGRVRLFVTTDPSKFPRNKEIEQGFLKEHEEEYVPPPSTTNPLSRPYPSILPPPNQENNEIFTPLFPSLSQNNIPPNPYNATTTSPGRRQPQHRGLGPGRGRPFRRGMGRGMGRGRPRRSVSPNQPPSQPQRRTQTQPQARQHVHNQNHGGTTTQPQPHPQPQTQPRQPRQQNRKDSSDGGCYIS